MPVPNPNKEPGAFEQRTFNGMFVGYFVQPGGKWSGDFLMLEMAGFKDNPDACKGTESQ